MSLNAMTAANLRSAYGGESCANTRYRIWGEKAEKDGFPNVKRLFDATAEAEQIHATYHFKALKDENGAFDVIAGAGFGLGDTSDNLQGAIDGETFEFTQMYPAYIAVAEMQEENDAIRAMRFAINAEKVHAKEFTKAKELVDQGKDLEVEDHVYLCPVCGFVTLDGSIDTCPLCGAKSSVFKKY